MNYTDYSSIAGAFITAKQQLIFIDDKGRKHPHPEKDSRKQEDILEKMEKKGFASFEADSVFNPQYVTEAYYDPSNHCITLRNGSAEWRQGLRLKLELAERKLQKLEKFGFIPWPHNRMFNREVVEDMTYDNEDSLLLMQDCHGHEYSAGISPEAAGYYLAVYNKLKREGPGTAIQTVPKAQPEEPPKEVPELDRDILRVLGSCLKSEVIGQDPAADALTTALFRNVAGLGDDDKPVGSFLFLGPTGVGKTEMATQLAEILGIPFLRLDMSEYQEKHSISRMIGSPPGYVGNEEGGQLTGFVHDNPRCVVMLDEIEKAHPACAKILLQIFDGARLTDGKGNIVRFNNAIVILTSNLLTKLDQEDTGPKKMNGIGFGATLINQTGEKFDKDETEEDLRKHPALIEFFSIEGLNRFDDILRFQSLKLEHMMLIVKKFLTNTKNKEGMKNVRFSVTPKAEKYLAEKGYDPILNARPLKRLIAKEIEARLAPELLFGKLEHGGTVDIDLKDGKLDIVFNAAANDNKVKTLPAPKEVLRLPAPAVS